MNNHHFLLISCAAQGHINPTFQLAKLLIRAGAHVTFATTIHGLHRMKTLPSLESLSYASFSDGFDNGTHPTDNKHHIMSEFKRVGSQTLTELVTTLSKPRPVTFLIYGLLFPWAADVARNHGIPSAFFCIQSATTFAIYHYYFCQGGMYESEYNNPAISIKLPRLPPLTCNDLPSFLLPTSPHAAFIPTVQEHIQTLEQDPNPCVLVNTFDALEEYAIKAIKNVNLIAIGPLVQSILLDGKDLSHESFRCDLFESSRNYLQWLNSKPDCSVVYVSFGSMVVLQRKHIEEILCGLLQSHRPFLWVIRKPGSKEEDVEDLIKNNVMEEEGLVVPWCSQPEVLSHRSLGCFVTHCGWNSTVESLTAGVPVIGYPQLSDQTTNAKLVEVWGTGVRARVNEEGVVEREEIRRCVEMVMDDGEKGKEMRRNAKKWKDLATAALKEGGSSDNNIKFFMESFCH